MRIGIPKEVKPYENRVGLTPAGVQLLCGRGHSVFVESGAGVGSRISDEDFTAAGATILDSAAKVWETADMVMKIKEPLPQEYGFFREGLVLFTYLHLAPEPELTRALLDKKTIGIAYETVQLPSGSLPLLAPMSEVAGRMASQIGANLLTKHAGGVGLLMGGVPGVEAANVTIIGGGIVGTGAAVIAMGLGACVTILDTNIDRLRQLDDLYGARLQTLASNPLTIAREVQKADLLVGAVLIPGARAPKLVTEEMVKSMHAGSVIVDVAIDQGGSVETIDRITSHADPVFVKHDVLHYSVPNMPGAVPRTSTFALANVTIPYALQLANKGWREACRDNAALAKGVNTADGVCTYEKVAEALGLSYTPVEQVLQ